MAVFVIFLWGIAGIGRRRLALLKVGPSHVYFAQPEEVKKVANLPISFLYEFHSYLPKKQFYHFFALFKR